jgi:uncharacterized OB-fold protein
MIPAELPVVAVDTTAESAPHWVALVRGEFVVSWCEECDHYVWPARPYCTVCMSAIESSRTLEGTGTVYSRAIVFRGAAGFASAAPYVLAYVALDGGPTVLANVIPDEGRRVLIGDRVRLIPSGGDETGAARFVPVES